MKYFMRFILRPVVWVLGIGVDGVGYGYGSVGIRVWSYGAMGI